MIRKDKNGFILRITIDIMIKRLGLFILTVLLSIISFLLIYFIFILNFNYKMSDKILADATNYSPNNSYVFKLYSGTLENINRFADELAEINGIDTGRIYTTEVAESNDIMLCINNGYANYCTLTSNGNKIDLSWKNGEDYPAYVGKAYAEKYPIGTRFTVGEEVYKIIGILDDSQQFITLPSGNQVHDGIPSEYLIVGKASENTYLNTMYIFSELSETEVRDAIIDKASKFGYGYIIESVYSLIRNNHSQEIEASQVVLFLAYIIFGITFVLICVVSISSVILNASTYAVLYAFGYKHRDIYRIILLENGIRMFSSVIPALAISSMYMIRSYSQYALYVKSIIIRTSTLNGGAILCSTAFIVFIVSSIIPLIIFKQTSISSLLSNKE